MADYGYADIGKLADFANNSRVGLSANDIMRFPRADVQPVKHGWWVDCTFYDPYEKSYEQNFEYKCSCCRHMIYNKPNDDDNLYCGRCGARMDGEQNDD